MKEKIKKLIAPIFLIYILTCILKGEYILLLWTLVFILLLIIPFFIAKVIKSENIILEVLTLFGLVFLIIGMIVYSSKKDYINEENFFPFIVLSLVCSVFVWGMINRLMVNLGLGEDPLFEKSRLYLIKSFEEGNIKKKIIVFVIILWILVEIYLKLR